MSVQKQLESRIAEQLMREITFDLIQRAMVGVPALYDLPTSTALIEALETQAKNGGIQVTVKLPSGKTLAKQKREAKR